MTETVHLTPEAAVRFPDIGTRPGTVVITQVAADERGASRPAWALVAWDGGITAWLPTEDLTGAPGAPQGQPAHQAARQLTAEERLANIGQFRALTEDERRMRDEMERQAALQRYSPRQGP